MLERQFRFLKKIIEFALLHTTNLYPTPHNLVRLGGMQELMREFKDIPIGLSDHTTDNLSSYVAITLGACIVEKHYTDTMERVGPDISCSMDEKTCKELILNSKLIKSMLGGRKEAAKEEQATIDFAFATVVAIKDISNGEKFSHDNIWVKRPGTGEIKAEYFYDIINKKSNRIIKEGEHISYKDIK